MKNVESDGTRQTTDINTNLTSEVLRRNFHAIAHASVESAVAGDAERAEPNRKRRTTLRASNRLPRILLVEDNWDHAYLALKALTGDGRYQVELVSSGAEALYKLNSGKFALVLLDYCLSGMNGLGLIRKIKELGQDIPVVMITGLGSEAVAVEAMKMGAYDYVVKSGSYITTLPMIIDKALERYELKKVKEQWDHWVLKRNRELGALSELGGAINQLLDSHALISAAIEKVKEILGADYGQIYRAESLQRKPEPTADAADAGETEEDRSGIPSIVCQVAESGEPVVLENVAPESGNELFEDTRGLRSSICVPLRSKQQMLGVLVIGSRKRLQFTARDMVFYMAIANQIAVAVENAQLYEAIKIQADRLCEFETKYRALAHVIPNEASNPESESKMLSLYSGA